MTTLVSISVSSNVPVRVGVADGGGNPIETKSILPPSGGASFSIHGEQYVFVDEAPVVAKGAAI